MEYPIKHIVKYLYNSDKTALSGLAVDLLFLNQEAKGQKKDIFQSPIIGLVISGQKKQCMGLLHFVPQTNCRPKISAARDNFVCPQGLSTNIMGGFLEHLTQPVRTGRIPNLCDRPVSTSSSSVPAGIEFLWSIKDDHRTRRPALSANQRPG